MKKVFITSGPDLGPNCLLMLSASGTCIHRVWSGALINKLPRQYKITFMVLTNSPVRHGGDKSRAL